MPKINFQNVPPLPTLEGAVQENFFLEVQEGGFEDFLKQPSIIKLEFPENVLENPVWTITSKISLLNIRGLASVQILSEETLVLDKTKSFKPISSDQSKKTIAIRAPLLDKEIEKKFTAFLISVSAKNEETKAQTTANYIVEKENINLFSLYFTDEPIPNDLPKKTPDVLSRFVYFRPKAVDNIPYLKEDMYEDNIVTVGYPIFKAFSKV